MTTCRESIPVHKNGCAALSQHPPQHHQNHQCAAVLSLDSIGLPAFAVDNDGAVVEWNTALCHASGLPPEDIMHSPLSVVEPADQKLWTTSLRRCLHGTNSTCDISLTGDAVDGLQRCRIRLTPQKADGRVIRALCFVELFDCDGNSSDPQGAASDPDLGEASSTDVSSSLHGLDVSICCTDMELRIESCNHVLTRISGYLEEDLIGRPFADVCYATKDAESIVALVQSAINGEAAAENSPVKFRTKTGRILDLLLNVAPRKSGSATTGWVLVANRVSPARLPMQHNGCTRPLGTARSTPCRYSYLPSPVFGVDKAGRIDQFNEKAAEVFGFSVDEVLGHPVEAMVTPDSWEAMSGAIENAQKGRGTTNLQLEIRTKHYDTRYLIINAAARCDDAHAITGMICVGQDSTEATKHDRSMVAMARELRQLIDLANAPIFGIDEDRDVNEWNSKTAEITGYSKEEAFDCNLVEHFIVPHMRSSVQDILENALQGRGTSNFELEFRTKSGEIRHLLVNATTRRDASNTVVGVVCVAQDVTESVQRDRAVAGMALELRQLIDCANAPIFGIDIDGNINEWNRSIYRITGFSKQDTFDEPLVEQFIAPAMQETVREILNKALAGIETSNYELEFISKTGEPRFIIVNATTRRDPDHNVVGVVGVGQDITEDRKHAEELQKLHVLQATQEATVEVERSMTAYFAHELRNPLSAIDSALNVMPDNLPQSVAVLVSGMRLCSSFMSTIMNNLLDVRKMEEGKMVLNTVPICLSSLLDGVFSMLAPSVKSDVTFHKTIQLKGKNWVLGDEHRIQQVYTNVVTNAIKYTNTGSITLDLSWDDKQYIRFSCTDTGPGIPKNEQTKLFQRYVQRGGAPGTGLGLAIAKHLVDLCGGSIYFDSDPTIKAGTTCIVSLPLPLCDPPEYLEDPEIIMIEEPLRFLIVDDVKMNRMMLERRIEKGIAPNCKITEACTGEEALEICKTNEFDVIIVDQFMEKAGGVMVGTDVVYAMRRTRITAIIVGCSGNDLEKEFRDAGADFIWQKPMPSNAQIIAHLRLAMASRLDV